MDTRQTDLYWFRLDEEIHVEDVDKFSGRNIHPDRVMTQWVLVLMTSGERSFRIYGEDHVAHGGDFFCCLLMCGIVEFNVITMRLFCSFSGNRCSGSATCKAGYRSYFASAIRSGSLGVALL